MNANSPLTPKQIEALRLEYRRLDQMTEDLKRAQAYVVYRKSEIGRQIMFAETVQHNELMSRQATYLQETRNQNP